MIRAAGTRITAPDSNRAAATSGSTTAGACDRVALWPRVTATATRNDARIITGMAYCGDLGVDVGVASAGVVDAPVSGFLRRCTFCTGGRGRGLPGSLYS